MDGKRQGGDEAARRVMLAGRRSPGHQAPAVQPTDVQWRLAGALHHHQAGRLIEAERLYRQVLLASPRNADVLHLLGVVGFQTGRSELAIDLIRKAIKTKGNVAPYYSNLGNALKQQGRLSEAVTCYRKALALDPNFADALSNLGNALKSQGQLDDAIACYRKALTLNSTSADTLYNLGNALRDRQQSADAVVCYRQALAVRPDLAEAHNNLGGLLKELGQYDEAVVHCHKATELKPDYADAHNNLGAALIAQGRSKEAVDHCRKAIALRPDFAKAHNNLGNALQAEGLLEDALACYHQAREMMPDDPEANLNIGALYLEQGRLEEAASLYRACLEVEPTHAIAHNNLALVLLAQGDLAAGWREYEWRWKTPQMSGERLLTQPQWRGEAAAGRTLLIHAEQGLGDTLQFCRYASLVAELGLRVVMQAQKPLLRLLRSLPGVDTMVATGDDLPAFDLCCPLLSLPLAFGTTLATIPASTSYLHPDPGIAAAWRTRLAMLADTGPRVGLAWAGNVSYAADRRRSLPTDQVASLRAIPELHFVSLQKDGPTAPVDFPLIDFMAEITDFADTAALIVNLDLVISVDTAVAHLAAALGKPVWLLNRYDSDWRWLVERTDSPWYPTMRIYRQPRPGDWTSVMADVARDLQRLAEGQT